MKNQTDSASEHRLTWEAMPWVVNGSASEAQRRSVAMHVRDCDDCRAELARQREWHASMVRERAATTDVDAGLHKLWKRIDQAEEDSAQASAAGARRHGQPPAGRWGGNALVYSLTFAVVVEAIGISVLGIGLLSRTGTSPSYRTLSDSAVRGDGGTIRMIPATSMTPGQLQALLKGLELQVVAGPNAVGAYALAPLSAQPSLDTQLAGLRAVPGMRLVEPIPAR